jgi:hypothetical protein
MWLKPFHLIKYFNRQLKLTAKNLSNYLLPFTLVKVLLSTNNSGVLTPFVYPIHKNINLK